MTSADAGHQLSCQVTASNGAGSAMATSAAAAVPAATPGPGTGPGAGTGTGGGGAPSSGGGGPGGTATAASVSAVSQTASRWREGRGLPQISRAPKRPPVGTTFSFTLNETAIVSFSFTQAGAGRRVGGRCVAQTKRNRSSSRCARTITAGTLTFSGPPGVNRVRFQGRISQAKKLRPGRYTLLISASADGHASAPATLTFTIVNG